MAYCKSCGKEINDNAVICVNCGATIDAPLKADGNKKRLQILLSIIGAAVVIYILFIIITTPNFDKIFSDCDLDSDWAEVGSDGSYLVIDDAPWYDEEEAVQAVNAKLGLPDSLWKKMQQTNSYDGRLTQTYYNVIVSWKYDSSNGLQIIYEKR
jgi:hypothetical protein